MSEQQGNNAEKIARQNQAQKSLSACKMRLEKEKKQQDNMKKSAAYLLVVVLLGCVASRPVTG